MKKILFIFCNTKVAHRLAELLDRHRKRSYEAVLNDYHLVINPIYSSLIDHFRNATKTQARIIYAHPEKGDLENFKHIEEIISKSYIILPLTLQFTHSFLKKTLNWGFFYGLGCSKKYTSTRITEEKNLATTLYTRIKNDEVGKLVFPHFIRQIKMEKVSNVLHACRRRLKKKVSQTRITWKIFSFIGFFTFSPEDFLINLAIQSKRPEKDWRIKLIPKLVSVSIITFWFFSLSFLSLPGWIKLRFLPTSLRSITNGLIKYMAIILFPKPFIRLILPRLKRNIFYHM